MTAIVPPDSPEPTSLPPSHWTRGTWLLIAILAVQVPLLVAYIGHMWERPHYQFIPLALAAAVFLAAIRLRSMPSLKPGQERFLLVLLAATWVLQFVAMFFYSYWLIGLSLPVTTAAILYAFGGWQAIRGNWPSFALVALCVPPPLGIDGQLVSGLRVLTSELGSQVLNVFEIAHLRNGNVLEVGERQLFVEEACSGINSLFSSLCCILVWAGLVRMHLLEALLLTAVSIAWLIAANTLRVVVVAVGIASGGIDLTGDLPHEILGMCTFALGLLLTWSTRQLYLFFFRSATTAKLAPAVAPVQPLAEVCLSKWAGWSFLTLTLAVSAGFVALYGIWPESQSPIEEHITERLEGATEQDLPAQGSWQFENFKVAKRATKSAFGEHSRSWYGRIGALKSIASVDYCFAGWHDLRVCYRNQGWEVSQTAEIVLGRGPVKQVALKRAGEQRGYLLFALFNGKGEPTAIPDDQLWGLWSRPQSLWKLLTGGYRGSRQAESTYQVQALVVSGGEIDTATREAAQALFQTTSRLAAERLLGKDQIEAAPEAQP